MNSDKILRCIVNMNGHALNYAPERWAYVPLITDISVKPTEGSPYVYYELINRARKFNPDIKIGSYVSWRLQDAPIQYPNDSIKRSIFPLEWIKHTNKPDLGNKWARYIAHSEVLDLAEPRNGDYLFIDNNVHPSALSTWFKWEDTCDFLQMVNFEENVIANIAGSPHFFKDSDIELLNGAVKGVAFEVPWHPTARSTVDQIKSVLRTYKQLLEQQHIVILMSVVQDGTERDKEMTLLAGLCMMVRNPGDAIFVARSFWQDRPLWESLPESLGAPLNACEVMNDLKMVRVFEKGVLTVNVQAREYSIELYS